MFQDLIDLRTRHNWVDKKKKDAGPKKLNEVHRDHEKEQLAKQNTSMGYNRNSKSTSRDYRDPRSNYGGGRYNSNQNDKKESNEWNTVQKTPRYDPSRMRNFGNNSSTSQGQNVRLGTSRKTWTNSNKSGSMTKNASTDSNSSRGKDKSNSNMTHTMNKFSALMDNQPHPASTKSLSNRFSALNNPSLSPNSGSSPNNSRNPSRERGPAKKSSSQQAMKRKDDDKFAKPAPPKPSPPKPQMSPEELKRKAQGVVKEYLSLNDLNEAEACCNEMGMQA